jgi:C4-dicarboxylate transporter DctQ subunit
MPFWPKARNLFDLILDASAYFSGAFLVFVMLAITFDVTRRKFFGLSSIWVVEIAEYCLLWVTLLAAPWVLKRNAHVRMDLLIGRLCPRNQALLNIITSALALACLVVIEWYSIVVTWDHYKIGYFTPTPLRLPQWIIMTVLPIGIFLLSVQFIRRIWGFRNDLKGQPGQEQRGT